LFPPPRSSPFPQEFPLTLFISLRIHFCFPLQRCLFFLGVGDSSSSLSSCNPHLFPDPKRWACLLKIIVLDNLFSSLLPPFPLLLLALFFPPPPPYPWFCGSAQFSLRSNSLFQQEEPKLSFISSPPHNHPPSPFFLLPPKNWILGSEDRSL